MGEPTAEEFETWLHPCDVIEHYHQQRELNPRSLVASMLADGLLRAAARPFVLNGRDHGLALIPRAVWPAAAKSEVWVQARFRFMWVRSEGDVTVSAYDVRIDPQVRDIPPPAHTASPPTTPPASGTTKRGGRPAGKNGEPIARIAMRLLKMSEADLASSTAEAVAADLIAEYQRLGLQPPSGDNARRDAAGILRAVRN